MNSSSTRKLLLGVVLAGALALIPGTAWADGGTTPNVAPTIVVGTTYYGSTATPNSNPYQDYYRIPALLPQDLVTVSAAMTGSGASYMCLAGEVDEFNWYQEWCNRSGDVRFTSNGIREVFQATDKASKAYLRIFAASEGPYKFTVESIRHQLSLKIVSPGTLRRNGTVTVQTFRSDGSGAPNGHILKLVVNVAGTNYVYSSAVSSGKATFNLNLPVATRGRSAVLTAISDQSPSHVNTRAAVQVGIDPLPYPVSVKISAPGKIARDGAVSVRAVRSNGVPVANGTRVDLVANVDGRNYLYKSQLSGGVANFKLNLPKVTSGRTVTLTAITGATSSDSSGRTALQSVVK